MTSSEPQQQTKSKSGDISSKLAEAEDNLRQFSLINEKIIQLHSSPKKTKSVQNRTRSSSLGSHCNITAGFRAAFKNNHNYADENSYSQSSSQEDEPSPNTVNHRRSSRCLRSTSFADSSKGKLVTSTPIKKDQVNPKTISLFEKGRHRSMSELQYGVEGEIKDRIQNDLGGDQVVLTLASSQFKRQQKKEMSESVGKIAGAFAVGNGNMKGIGCDDTKKEMEETLLHFKNQIKSLQLQLEIREQVSFSLHEATHFFFY